MSKEMNAVGGIYLKKLLTGNITLFTNTNVPANKPIGTPIMAALQKAIITLLKLMAASNNNLPEISRLKKDCITSIGDGKFVSVLKPLTIPQILIKKRGLNQYTKFILRLGFLLSTASNESPFLFFDVTTSNTIYPVAIKQKINVE